MSRRKLQTCRECHKSKEGCKSVWVDNLGFVWVCPQCYKERDYDTYDMFRRMNGKG